MFLCERPFAGLTSLKASQYEIFYQTSCVSVHREGRLFSEVFKNKDKSTRSRMVKKKKEINSAFVCKQDWGHAEIKHSLIITVLNVWVHCVLV